MPERIFLMHGDANDDETAWGRISADSRHSHG